MFKRHLTLMLVGALLFSLCSAPMTMAKSKEEKAAEFTSKVKTGIAKLGVGPEARIEVKLRDKTKLKGYVSQINDSSFVIADAKTGATTEVTYPNVTSVTGKNLSTGAIIAISVAIAVGATLLVLIALAYATD
ncbi:MAG TPA: hypothetical protein PLK30_13305 [Blastocatellia bacterium]|nr:hypothetical protein [Blastocatellia bacterium]